VFVKYFKVSLTIHIHALLLHVSATHRPSSGNICYWGDHCTVHFVFCALRHIVVVAVNFLPRIFPSYLFDCYFSLFYIVYFCCVCFSAVFPCTNTENIQTYIQVSSGIRTHDPRVWAGEDISRLRPRGHVIAKLWYSLSAFRMIMPRRIRFSGYWKW
jgi:hypothetical protein